MMNLTKKHTEYIRWLNELKSLIQKTQIKVSISVNKKLLSLSWTIGKSISEKVNIANWGSSVVEELSKDLKVEFPNQKGFSRSNFFSMKNGLSFILKQKLTLKKSNNLLDKFLGGTMW